MRRLQTDAEWLEQQFAFGACEDCDRGAAAHTVVTLNGHRYAVCQPEETVQTGVLVERALLERVRAVLASELRYLGYLDRRDVLSACYKGIQEVLEG